ncbi:MAG: BON domain-containing protein [Betaproteobacteria bacterium]|nr:BON domain-containing protein [Betaproteobacteria bacterium]
MRPSHPLPFRRLDMRRIVSASLLALAVAGLAACNRDAGPEAGRPSAGAGNRDTATAQARGDASDATITAAVNAKLATDSELSAMRINVDTNEGKVVLKGDAPTPSASERAVRLAQGVDGVKSVDNQLQVRAGG